MTRRAIVLVLDGLRRDWVTPDLTPAIHGFGDRATSFTRHRSVFPSCTRVVSASVATGCLPARHGIQGNMLALMEGGRPVLHDVGPPGFFDHRRAVTGRAMDCPTWAERLAGMGGCVVFSNVSPGAAHGQDPDGHGRVYHRAGSYGPGRVALASPEALSVTPDTAGDAAMVARFRTEVLEGARPALGVLWCGNPDTAQHRVVLGSPEHHAVLREVDRIVAGLLDRIAAQDDTLVVLASDHGHEAVCGSIDVGAALRAEGFMDRPGGADIAVAPNGSAVLIYLGPQAQGLRDALADWIAAQPWSGAVHSGDGLAAVGLSAAHGLALAVSLAASDAPNAFGVTGTTLVAGRPDLDGPALGTGTHGGLGAGAQAPFLMMRGHGFAPGATDARPTSAIDIAPSVLHHLGLGADGMDGRALQLPSSASPKGATT